MKMIYLVTAGDYSDYHVIGAFSKREKAEKFIDRYDRAMRQERAEIEEYVLDELKPVVSKLVRMDKEGNTVETWERMGQVGFVCFDIDSNLVWAVQTEDEKRAVKVTNEKRAIILANNEWGKHQE